MEIILGVIDVFGVERPGAAGATPDTSRSRERSYRIPALELKGCLNREAEMISMLLTASRTSLPHPEPQVQRLRWQVELRRARRR